MNQPLVTTREHPSPSQYVLLEPGNHPARTGPGFQVLADWRDISHTIQSARESRYLAVDFETRGADYATEDIDLIGIGLAWDKGSVYFSVPDLSPDNYQQIIDLLHTHQGLLAHNVYFDGGILRTLTGKHAPWHICTYALLAHLANEGHLGQYWGLKDAMTSLLGWESSNETELDEWLVTNGYYTGVRRINNEVEYLRAECRAGKLRPDKSQMWRAPGDILGKYCVLDAEACYLLHTQVLNPALEHFPGLQTYMRDFMGLIELLIDQKIAGIDMNREGLQSRRTEVHSCMVSLERDILNLPDIAPHVNQLEQEMIQPLREKEPARWKIDGGESKNWQKWRARLDAAERGELPEYKFNVNSSQQLRELLYVRMGFTSTLLTESGLEATSIKALTKMGQVGQLLVQYNYLQKELGFLDDYLERTVNRSTIHPSFRTPGTVTGRLSSKNPNLQQVPKTKTMMSLFRCRPGYSWVDVDFAALESVVAAEFSQDPNLLALYGDNVPENDIHLFLAAHVPGEMSEAVLLTGYTPYGPPAGSVGRAKKEAKHWRSIAKTANYAFQYKASPMKVASIFEAEGISISFPEVERIYNTYWDLFAVLKEFGRNLLREWRGRDGWIYNGLGRPMAVPEEMTKDLLNRFIQSTGHDILVRYIRILCILLHERGIQWAPTIMDWHDATTIEVPQSLVADTVQTMNDAMQLLNNELGGTIRLSGKPTWGNTLADIKEPE